MLFLNLYKGAARKISKCVQKLHERSQTLTDICESLEKGCGDLVKHLSDLEDVVRSPLLVEDGEESGGRVLLSQIVLSLTKLCSSLLLSPTTDSKTGSIPSNP